MNHTEYCWWVFLPHILNVMIFQLESIYDHLLSRGFTEGESAELSKANLQRAMWNPSWKPHLQLGFSPPSAFSLKCTLNNSTTVHRVPNIKLVLMIKTIIIFFKQIDWSQEIDKLVHMQSEFYIFHQKNNSLPMTNNSRATKTTCHASNEDRFSSCHV